MPGPDQLPGGQGCGSRASPRPRACSPRRGGGAAPGQGEACCAGPSSFLVVIGGVREGKLQAVGLSQQQADVLIAPLGCGQVLKEEQQLLGEERQARVRAGDQPRGRGLQTRGSPWWGLASSGGEPERALQPPDPMNCVPSPLDPEPRSQEKAPRMALHTSGRRCWEAEAVPPTSQPHRAGCRGLQGGARHWSGGAWLQAHSRRPRASAPLPPTHPGALWDPPGERPNQPSPGWPQTQIRCTW